MTWRTPTTWKLESLIQLKWIGDSYPIGFYNGYTLAQWKLVEESIAFYRSCAAVIRDGMTFRCGPEVQSYAHPKGYQIVVRAAQEQAMAVVHTFAGCGNVLQEQIPALAGCQICGSFGAPQVGLSLDGAGILCVEQMREFDGLVILARRAGQQA